MERGLLQRWQTPSPRRLSAAESCASPPKASARVPPHGRHVCILLPAPLPATAAAPVRSEKPASHQGRRTTQRGGGDKAWGLLEAPFLSGAAGWKTYRRQESPKHCLTLRMLEEGKSQLCFSLTLLWPAPPRPILLCYRVVVSLPFLASTFGAASRVYIGRPVF